MLGTAISSTNKLMSKFDEWMILFFSKHRNCIKAKILHKNKYIAYVYSRTVIHDHCYRLNCITRHQVTHGKSLMSLNIGKCENGVFKSTMWSDFWWNFSIFGTRSYTIFCAHLNHAIFDTGKCQTCENFIQPQHFGCYDALPQTVNVGYLMLVLALNNWCPCHKKKQHNCMCAEKIQIKPGVSLLDTKERDLRRNQIYWHIAHLATRVWGNRHIGQRKRFKSWYSLFLSSYGLWRLKSGHKAWWQCHYLLRYLTVSIV